MGIVIEEKNEHWKEDIKKWKSAGEIQYGYVCVHSYAEIKQQLHRKKVHYGSLIAESASLIRSFAC